MKERILELIDDFKDSQKLYYDIQNPDPNKMMMYATYSEFIEALEELLELT